MFGIALGLPESQAATNSFGQFKHTRTKLHFSIIPYSLQRLKNSRNKHILESRSNYIVIEFDSQSSHNIHTRN